jgi:hypothetical protein
VGSACQRPLVADVLAIPLPPTRADGDGGDPRDSPE